jgi:hypothetical protein
MVEKPRQIAPSFDPLLDEPHNSRQLERPSREASGCGSGARRKKNLRAQGLISHKNGAKSVVGSELGKSHFSNSRRIALRLLSLHNFLKLVRNWAEKRDSKSKIFKFGRENDRTNKRAKWEWVATPVKRLEKSQAFTRWVALRALFKTEIWIRRALLNFQFWAEGLQKREKPFSAAL